MTDAQCNAAGIDELRPCGVGQACSAANECVAQECETSANCESADEPTCTNGLCVAGCSIDDDCLGVPGAPKCQTTTGECVGCLMNDDCPTEAEICDSATLACRGCGRDSECSNGVCIEADGVCADDAEVIFVSDPTGSDIGDCPRSAPCRTLGFALGLVDSTRHVVKVLSGSLDLGNGTALDSVVVLDGTNTVINFGGTTAVLVRSLGATIEGFEFRVSGASQAFSIVDFGVLRIFDVSVDGGGTSIDGTIEVVESDISNQQFSCFEGSVRIQRSRFSDSQVTAQTCAVTIERSQFRTGPKGVPMLDFLGGLIRIENSTLVETGEFSNLLSIRGSGAGSFLRFSNLLHATLLDRELPLIICDGIELTSNIIAINSADPLSANCNTSNSLFDATATDLGTGTGNVTGDVATFFVDRENGDFHLAPNSPARELGMPGLVAVDLDGSPRPSPTGTNPDSGAYEAQ